MNKKKNILKILSIYLKNYKKIVGPVDASFWIKYRLKINKFERPYTGEPYNLKYYYKLFTDNSFKVCDHYTSQVYEQVDETYSNVKFTEHFKEFKKLGYKIEKESPIWQYYQEDNK